MADDRIDWASVMAVHTMATAMANCAGYEYTDGETPVPLVIADVSSGEPEPEAIHLAIAAALREAHEAGQRESGNLYTEHSRALDRLLEQAEELAALRRELAARRAVDGWLGESNSRYLEVGILSGLLNAVERHRDVDGIVAAGATYPALAAALGLEVE